MVVQLSSCRGRNSSQVHVVPIYVEEAIFNRDGLPCAEECTVDYCSIIYCWLL